MIRRPFSLLLSPLVLTMFFAGCGGEPAEPVVVSRPVKMMTLTGGGTGDERKYPGTVKAFEIGYMSFEVAGRIVKFPVREGQDIKKGDLIAELDGRDYLAKVNASKARVDQARAEYDRNRALYEREAISLSKMQVAQRNFEVAEADFNVENKAYEDTFLRAPFDGVVAKKIAENFQQVRAKEEIAIVEDNSQLKIVIDVPERDFVNDSPEQPSKDIDEINKRLGAQVAFSSLPERRFPVDLMEFATRADSTTQTFEATFVMTPPKGLGLLPGMTATVMIKGRELGLREGDTFLVPSLAVFTDSTGKSYVWKVVDKDGKQVIAKTEVQKGVLAGENITVEKGLVAGDTIVVSGVQALREGQPVTRLAETGSKDADPSFTPHAVEGN